ncbi:carbohydrate-binding module family 43 protein/Glycoside hydrolase family 72 protein [Serpula lacrymans var. lacrymans S7.3]|uniref:1,3-beta-glucanosyltransferase n=2 Tax=Serpula lacrymans var. lacrymans TaxID=341189 RepID=F8PMI9_SERL3|nr:glycoside hydrolase family 72 protein [Serpula lacrymans var. lacrymans S7.9]EGO02821.1 carbohydrate-binding module family 43 protein/Glycoside hydrolase family 72 protein [Serpula lacrymans var. lacrymans S7.3]EGO28520.1 glycoside hydrolase family 72 protein [Serpula lacrymans var. lacrymans S7.9]
MRTSVLAVVGALVASVQAIQKVTRSGRYLYTQDGNRFYIKGVAYQEQGAVVADPNNPFLEPSNYIDPLANGTVCQRDLPYLQQLGVNAVRAYSVNASLNHDTCMKMLSNAGIYTIIDLSLPVNGSLDRNSPSWTTNLLDLYIETIDSFSGYDNVLAYNVGNEVVIAANGTGAAAYVKAAARDVKAYLNSKKSSSLVGYASIDGDATWLDPLANYLSCDPSGSNSGSAAIDLYGLNNYQWCGNSTFQSSYAGTEGQFAGYNVPAYFSEFGCITSPPRLWTEVGALYSSQMSDVWSGGVAFSYFPAQSAQGQFGMVTISADGSTVFVNNDFTSLKTQYGSVTPPNIPTQSSAGSTAYPSCPQPNSSFVASNHLPPTPNLAACQCLQDHLSCQFTPQTQNYSGIVGPLLDYACSLVGQAGGNCLALAGNGTTGSYGPISGCDPSVMLSYVMSEYYLGTNLNPQSCSFAGNGTINHNAPSSASAANAAASSCLSSATGTFTPQAPSSGGSSGGSSKGSGSSNGASVASSDAKAVYYVGVMLAVGFASGMWTLT